MIPKIASEEVFGLDVNEIKKIGLFANLYNMFTYRSPTNELNDLINPDLNNPLTIRDWQKAYWELDSNYMKIKEFDPTEISIIANRFVESYTSSYQYMISNAKTLTFKNLDLVKYNQFFMSLMKGLKRK